MRQSVAARSWRAVPLIIVVVGALLSWASPAALPPATAVPVTNDGAGTAFSRTPIVIAPPSGTEATQPVDPYPSTSTVWGLDGPITDVDVVLGGVDLWRTSEVQVLLVSPSGTAVRLISPGWCPGGAVTNRTWYFDDEASAQFGAYPCASGSYHIVPTGIQPEFPAPAPQPPYAQSLSAFDGENPNGNWRLYVHDVAPRHFDPDHPTGPWIPVPEDHGQIKYGYAVEITTDTQSVVIGDHANGTGPATPYPYVVPVSGKVGRIEDVFVYLEGLGHDYPDDLDVLLVAPTGQSVLLLSDVCGNHRLRLATTWQIHDGSPAFPDEADCATGGAGGGGVQFAPTDYQPGDLFPAPAPPGPYGHYLAGLDGLDPNGNWKVYINDDSYNGSGYLKDVKISFVLGPPVADTTPPDTTITTNPGTSTTSRRATFGFTSSESPATFECRLDSGTWQACSSPREYRGLVLGRHVFRVRASDAAGNVDPTPARWVWRRQA
jgi:subtilisin-like proprotein convertase family protein